MIALALAAALAQAPDEEVPWYLERTREIQDEAKFDAEFVDTPEGGLLSVTARNASFAATVSGAAPTVGSATSQPSVSGRTR